MYLYVSVCICTLVCGYLKRPKEVAGITGGCESPNMDGCWKPNPGALEDQQVLLTTEPFLQALTIFNCNYL